MDPHPKTKRLHVVIAEAGIASRRAAETLIQDGYVKVNGVRVTTLGIKVDPTKDKIEVDGKVLKSSGTSKKQYYLFYKPLGVTTTMSDPHAYETIADFLRDVPERLYPVGRLDQNSTGLLLLTNDGELAHRLTHPSFGVKKQYHVVLDQNLTRGQIAKLKVGVSLEEGRTAGCDIEQLASKEFLFILHEGKKRQIRRMAEQVGAAVVSLHREAYGPLTLGNLRPGEKRSLTLKEVKLLYSLVGLK